MLLQYRTIWTKQSNPTDLLSPLLSISDGREERVELDLCKIFVHLFIAQILASAMQCCGRLELIPS